MDHADERCEATWRNHTSDAHSDVCASEPPSDALAHSGANSTAAHTTSGVMWPEASCSG